MTEPSMERLNPAMPTAAEEASQLDKDIKDVGVTFTPPAKWEFTQPVVTMKRKGIIKLQQVPPDQGWDFADAEVLNDTKKQFRHEPRGKQWWIHDDFDGDGKWCYTVTVRTKSGKTYVSPDPQIINQTPT